jgi:chemotaxis signal transduction protein
VVHRGAAFTPVIDADSLLGSPAVLPSDSVQIVVLGEHVGGVGLAVRQILDVEAAGSPLQTVLASRGIVGSVSLGGIATEVLDLDSVVAASASGNHVSPA